jgi:transposase InsO family protein
VADDFVRDGRCSGRQVCRYFKIHRSSYRYKAKEPDAWLKRLKSAVRHYSLKYRKWGYVKITKLLKDDGWAVGKRRIQAIRRELGLRIPKRKPRQRRQGPSTGVPTKATHRGHVWCWDFIHDRTTRGGALKMLTVVDEYTRECHLIHVARRIQATDVLSQLFRLIERHGAPEHIRSDNGSEFIEKSLRGWLDSRFRDECLDREQLWTLTEARVVLEDWRKEYNEIRPHKSLNLETPKRFAEKSQDEPSGRATPSLRPRLDRASILERYITYNLVPGLTLMTGPGFAARPPR